MINNKKGLSMIVSTLIIILLVLVAVGVIWVVVNNLIQSGSDQVELSSKCLDVDIQATKVECIAEGTCAVTLERTSTGDEIKGVMLAFSNADGTANYVYEEEVSIEPLAVHTIGDIGVFAELGEDPAMVKVTTYFEDSSGNQQLCSQAREFSFTVA